MNSISMFKNLAVVLVLLVSVSFEAFAASEQEKQACRSGGGTWKVISGGSNITEFCDEERKTKKIDDCRKKLDDINKARGTFSSYCKKEEKSKISECSERLSTCSESTEEEKPFSVIAGMFGMPAVPGLSGETQGVCSKYTQDKLDGLIDKAKSRLDTKQEKELEAKKKAAEDEEKSTETRQKKQEEFLEQQEKKTEAELKDKEEDRNQEATFDKQQQEYEAKIRQLDDEIFSIQKAQQLLMQKRRIDIAGYKGMMHAARLKCNSETKKAISSLDPNYNKSGSFQGSQKKQKDIQDLFTSCMDMETGKRITEAEQFKVDMERFDRQISNKTAELAAIKQSSEKMKKMFAQAKQDAALKKQKDEETFMRKQMNKWQEIVAYDQAVLKKQAMHAEAVAKAGRDINQASNELMKLESQEALPENKTAAGVHSDYVKDYTSSLESYKSWKCDDKDTGLPSASEVERGGVR